MRRDHRPYWMHALWERYENWWARTWLAPHFEALGENAKIVRPWHVEVFGPNIAAGKALHMVASRDAPVRLTVWSPHEKQGRITLGDAVFLAGGVRLMAAEEITVGDACLFAARVTITDCDWHGLYDRVDPAPAAKPVRIGNNVWLGDGVFVGKGVTIGDHAVAAARAVVVRDVPPWAVVAGCPAKVVKMLDPAAPMKTRLDLLGDVPGLTKFMEAAYRQALKGNSTFGWLRSKLFPRRGD
ncbi:MAG: acyltransferase [Maricaulaceae bacterium]|nr:acyltransferase [Maricaulaceae bacterium]